MGKTTRGGKPYYSVMTYFTLAQWKKVLPTKKRLEKKIGYEIADSEFIRQMVFKAAKVKDA